MLCVDFAWLSRVPGFTSKEGQINRPNAWIPQYNKHVDCVMFLKANDNSLELWPKWCSLCHHKLQNMQQENCFNIRQENGTHRFSSCSDWLDSCSLGMCSIHLNSIQHQSCETEAGPTHAWMAVIRVGESSCHPGAQLSHVSPTNRVNVPTERTSFTWKCLEPEKNKVLIVAEK